MRPLPQAMVEGCQDWHPETASWLADAAALAYQPFDDIERAFRSQSDGPSLTFFDREGTQAYLAEYDSCTVIAFRGTQRDYRDILTDLDFRKAAANALGGKVHRGFYTALGAIQPDLERAVRFNRPIYITGHSLGGALALLAASVLNRPIYLMRTNLVLYTFGCPRVGNEQFTTFLHLFENVRHYRVTNVADVVPWVPFMSLQFRHGGEHRHLTHLGGLIVKPGILGHLANAALALVPDIMKARCWRDWLPVRLFTDHRVSAYQTKLWNLSDD